MSSRHTSRNGPAKAVLYVCTTDGDLGASIAEQRAALFAYATTRGLDIVGRYEDRLPSSGCAILDRPGLTAGVASLRRVGGGEFVLVSRAAAIPATIDLALLIALTADTGPSSRVVAATGTLVRRGEDQCRVTSVARCLMDLQRHVLAEEQERQRARGIRQGGRDQVPDCWPPDLP